MKDIITSLVRHALTFLAGLGAALHSSGLIGSEDVSQVNDAGVTLMTVLTGLIVTVISRLLMTYGGKLFKDLGNGGGMASFLLCMGAGFLVLSLPSCTHFENAETLKAEMLRGGGVRACYETRQGRVCYGSDGLSVDIRSGK